MDEVESGEEVVSADRHRPTWFVLVRDTLLTMCGLALLFNEAVLAGEPRTTLVLTAMSMLGAPGITVAKQLLGR